MRMGRMDSSLARRDVLRDDNEETSCYTEDELRELRENPPENSTQGNGLTNSEFFPIRVGI